jgi:hypothetical protein
MSKPKDPRDAFRAALEDKAVLSAARAIQRDEHEPSLAQMLELGRALSSACGATETAAMLEAELIGYQEAEVEIPPERSRSPSGSPSKSSSPRWPRSARAACSP